MHRQFNRRNWTFAFLSVLIMASVAKAETIHLKSGKAIEGTIVARTADAVKVDTGVGVPITYYLDEIESIANQSAAPLAPKTTELPAPAIKTPPPAGAVPPQPAVKTPAPKQPMPPASPVPRKTGKEIELYTQATTPPTPTRRLTKEEYLRIQFHRANALLKEEILKAIEYLKGRVGQEWRGLKDSYPAIKNLAEGPAGVPVGIVFWISLYALICIPLMRIAAKITDGSWMAWVPVLQIFLVIRMADKSLLWFLFLLFPFVNLLAFLFLWTNIARRLDKPHWLGYFMLVPGVNVLILWYLALIPVKTSPPPPEKSDTGIQFQ